MKYYNRTNTCDRCGNRLISCDTYREHDKEGKWTGKWLCRSCWNTTDYDKRPDSIANIIKSLRDHRMGNLDPNSTSGKGYILEVITCKARGIKNLNCENYNFHTPIDHSTDPEYGILQSKGATYSPIYRTWHLDWSNEHSKDFDNLIFYCMSKYMKSVERIYIFPYEEVIMRSGISITKNFSCQTHMSWYEKYEVDEKQYNDTYRNLKLIDCPGLRNEKGVQYVYELF